MAFTGTINSITPSDDGTGSGILVFTVGVTFADSVSGWSMIKSYNFPANTTQAQAQAAITTDGTAYKTKLGLLSNLQQKVGTVITI